MKGYSPYSKSRPNLKPYQLIAGVLIVLWLSFIWIIQLKAQETGMVLRDMKPVMAWGIAAIVCPLLMIFGTHWWGNALASEKAELANYRKQVEAKKAE
ncbi:hypothetical protein N5F17_13045, partial [Pseudomonas sp. GD03746]|nr:hypothetical protein [Pseudomonas sp. GD03746]